MRKLDLYTFGVTLGGAVIIIGSLWQFYPSLLVNPGWLKNSNVSVSEDIQRQLLTAGAMAGAVQTAMKIEELINTAGFASLNFTDASNTPHYLELIKKPK